MGEWFWPWWEAYKANREHIIPLLTFVAASIVAWAALRQARTATRQAKTAAEQARIAMLRHEEQTKADLQRSITKSFTKAVEQLGREECQVRLGGIYTLERIAREIRFDYRPVMETLTAFIREQTLRKQKDTLASENAARICENEAPQPSTPKPPTDVAAVLGVIMRLIAQKREREISENCQDDEWPADEWGEND
jgi:hypothetical protein